ARAPVTQPGQTPGHARAAVPMPGTGLRLPLPRAAARHAGTRSSTRRAVPTDSPAARRCAARGVAALGRTDRLPASAAVRRPGLEGGAGHRGLPLHAVRGLRLDAGRTARPRTAALPGHRRGRGIFHAVRDEVTWTSSNTRPRSAVSWRGPGSGAC